MYICVDNVNTAKLWYYLINKKNLQKGRTLVIYKNWRGCENIDWGYYNTQADPDMLYNGYTFNYWDIEDALWNEFCELNNYDDSQSGDFAIESKFSAWVKDNAESYLDNCICSGYFAKGSKSWHDSI